MTDQQTGLTLDAISIFEKCELKRKKKVYVGLSNEISINITILGHSTFDRECLVFNFFMLINHINLSNFKAFILHLLLKLTFHLFDPKIYLIQTLNSAKSISNEQVAGNED